MTFDYRKLEEDLTQLLAAMTSLAPSEVSEVREFLAAGEYGVAFETLCGIIKEESKPVPKDVRRKIRELAERMKIDPTWWAGISNGE
ncbi:MAG: MafI family immunity protein [Reyranella sp.]|uniref:MafI family immunity protein n=1 Tax=Reyranella sp. TaxID=1929291 RepID=UPI001221884F|nr:MafI family immunity protein [Reyranella sp.]TAJ39442.1 MAG: MafI family immunity protein [Reyranella sp.]